MYNMHAWSEAGRQEDGEQQSDGQLFSQTFIDETHTFLPPVKAGEAKEKALQRQTWS